MYEDIIKMLLEKHSSGKIDREKLLLELYENEELKNNFSSEIRRSTIIGEIANETLKRLGDDYEFMIMAIGDIKYHGKLEKKWNKLVEKSIKKIDVNNLGQYDLIGIGTEKLRSCFFEYMNHYYEIPHLKEFVENEIIPSYGATDGLDLILQTIRQINGRAKINFVYPEASFLPSINIAKTYSCNPIPILKPSAKNFFIEKTQLDNYFKENPKLVNIFYITSVANPTGEKLADKKFLDILKEINKKDENAIIILDNVYVGLLKNEEATNMFKEIFEDEKLFNQIIFCESLSKTLGMTGIRIGWTWTVNQKLNKAIRKNMLLKKAGFSKLHTEFAINLLKDTKKYLKFQKEASNYFSKQKMDFVEYVKEDFKKFFDFSKSPIVKEHQGIYVLLKLKEGLNSQEVFAKTGMIGVEINLSDGKYIRYSFGNSDYF